MADAPVLPSHRVPRRPAALDLASWADLQPWSGIPALAPLLRSDGSGAAARATCVRVCCDDAALWVRFDNEDDDPRATLTTRDAPLWSEDVVEVFIAAGAETPKVYYEFEVNPLGALFDARVSNPHASRRGMIVETGWDCAEIAWGASIDKNAGQWSARLRIPWRAIGAESRAATWRANFYRIDDPGGTHPEYSAWSPTGTWPPDFHRPVHFGTLFLDQD